MTTLPRVIWWSSLLGLLLHEFSFLSQAHPVSMTRATFDVGEASIHLSLKVPLEDLVLFHQLPPDDAATYDPDQFRQAAQTHEAIVLERLLLMDDRGEVLAKEVRGRDLSAIGEAPIPQEALMERWIVYDVVYSLSDAASLVTIVQRFAGDDLPMPAVMDLTMRAEGRLLERPTQLLENQPHTVSLRPIGSERDESDWERLRRQSEVQARERLGIESYSALYSFLYVERREVRHELLVPLLVLEEWLPIERASAERLTVAEQEQLSEPLAAFFRERAPIQVDGQWVKPELDRAQFFGVSITDFAQNAPAREVNLYQGRVGVILRYPLADIPESVTVPWKIFSSHGSVLQSRVYVFDQDSQKFRFWQDQDTWTWQTDDSVPLAKLGALPAVPSVSIMRLPVASMVLALLCAVGLMVASRKRARPTGLLRPLSVIAGVLGLALFFWRPVAVVAPWTKVAFSAQEDEERLLAGMLERIYRAFEGTVDRDIYEDLSLVVRDEMLEPLYLTFVEGLTLREQGGAVTRVTNLQIRSFRSHSLKVDSRREVQLAGEVAWSVRGTVDHWGHIHERQLGYRADVLVVGSERGWQIAALDVKDESLTMGATRVRN